MSQNGFTPEQGQVRNGDEVASQTTSIGLPDLEPVADPSLADGDRETINALPVGSALLVAHAGPNQGARFLLDQDVTSVGRHPNSDIFLDDVTVSRKHARFERSGEAFTVVDAGSLNGTYVNHDRVDSITLRPGMEVQIGKFRLTYYSGTQRTAS
ncbi:MULTISPECIES: FHA domain-containing protein [Citricoccus]|uniref:FHA domain-containing protein n=1 Tax=Citricoccus muralis TaxID=169134 RepID=A0ABY8H323_9MICC|nr:MULTISPECIES: FHA domain-containing protein [Citricoccus]WBL18088.1 FHA domain-containing protein [Citricoccus sp. NR2]WFP15530.1 FHA domain-containing protein [Citricoccus muralis]